MINDIAQLNKEVDETQSEIQASYSVMRKEVKRAKAKRFFRDQMLDECGMSVHGTLKSIPGSRIQTQVLDEDE